MIVEIINSDFEFRDKYNKPLGKYMRAEILKATGSNLKVKSLSNGKIYTVHYKDIRLLDNNKIENEISRPNEINFKREYESAWK